MKKSKVAKKTLEAPIVLTFGVGVLQWISPDIDAVMAATIVSGIYGIAKGLINYFKHK